MRAGRRWTGQAFPSLLAAAALAALGGGPIVPPTRINDLQLDQNKQQRKR